MNELHRPGKETFIENYKNLSGTSGVLKYGIGDDFIDVEFNAGRRRFYKYSYASAGLANVEHMKKLALQGQGLNSFIGLHVRKNYESCW